MTNLQKLVKNSTLTETLMANEKFIKDAKEILKKENIEVSDEQLSALIKKIESELNKPGVLDEKNLENISGGSAAGIVIKTTTAIVGAAVGAYFGGKYGEIGANKLNRNFTDDNVKENLLRCNFSDSFNSLYAGTSRHKDIKLAGKYGGGSLGAIGGGALGYALGNLICKVAGV